MEQQRRQRQASRYRPMVVVPRRPRAKPRFRWSIVLVPLALLFAAWVIGNVKPAGTWADVLDFLRVRHRERYSMLACSGLVVICVVLIARILGSTKKEKE